MEMEGSGERDELIWRQERGRSLITETFSTLSLSLHLSIHLTHSYSAKGAEQTYLGKTNMRDYMSQKHTCTNTNQNKQTEKSFPDGEETGNGCRNYAR